MSKSTASLCLIEEGTYRAPFHLSAYSCGVAVKVHRRKAFMFSGVTGRKATVQISEQIRIDTHQGRLHKEMCDLAQSIRWRVTRGETGGSRPLLPKGAESVATACASAAIRSAVPASRFFGQNSPINPPTFELHGTRRPQRHVHRPTIRDWLTHSQWHRI